MQPGSGIVLSEEDGANPPLRARKEGRPCLRAIAWLNEVDVVLERLVLRGACTSFSYSEMFHDTSKSKHRMWTLATT